MVTTKHFGLDTDSTFANDTDYTIPSTKAVKTALGNKQNTNTAVTHTASTAAGSVTQPVYVAADGTATATTYSLAKSVPADAIFTDTTYSAFTGADGTTAGAAGLVPAPAATDNTKFLKGDGTWTAVSTTLAQTGSTIQPIYIDSNGAPQATTYSLEKSVPSDAVFTDTTYSAFVGAGSSTDGAAGLVKKPVAGDNVKYLKGDGTWASIAYTELTNVPSSFAPAAHTHVTQDVTALTGYTIASTAASIAATDTLNEALGKLQKSIDGKQAAGSYVPTTRTINNKALSSDITLSAADVSALPSSTTIPTVTFKTWS